MSDEYMSIKEGVNELKETLKVLVTEVTEMRVDIVSNYVKKKDNDSAHWKFTGWIISLFGFILAAAGTVVAILKKG